MTCAATCNLEPLRQCLDIICIYLFVSDPRAADGSTCIIAYMIFTNTSQEVRVANQATTVSPSRSWSSFCLSAKLFGAGDHLGAVRSSDRYVPHWAAGHPMEDNRCRRHDTEQAGQSVWPWFSGLCLSPLTPASFVWKSAFCRTAAFCTAFLCSLQGLALLVRVC